jgi:hypothetical protein
MELFIIIKRKYFDEIRSGRKTKEYRLVTPYWTERLKKPYTHIVFQVGYNKKNPRMKIEYKGWEIENIRHEFFGNEKVTVFAIKLGEIIKTENV